MDGKREAKKIDIINKYGPRHSSITGKSVKILADFLCANGQEVHTFSIDTIYRGQVASQVQLPYSVHELKPVYDGNNKLIRLLVSLLDGFRLIFSSCIKGDADIRIFLTDPPLINFWATFFKPFSRSRWICWTMDLYPDAFCSAKLVNSGNPVFRLIHRFVYHHTPDFMIALGEQQYDYLKRNYGREIPHTVLPCGINPIKQGKTVPWWKEKYKDKIILCYAGNLGEAHDDLFLIRLIEMLDPGKFLMILALYGAKAENVLRRAGVIPGVVLTDYVSAEELAFADINVASLLPCWDHVCVPSKVVSAICAGSPVLYNASDRSEGYCMFPDAIWLIRKSENYDQAIGEFYRSVDKKTINRKKQAALNYAYRLAAMQENAFQDIIHYCNMEKLSNEYRNS
ncbi:hypothetical protein AALM74_25390 [Parabacteroides segnis]|uniref:hypothetical protein n=1 Tax=Parabacteroides segnis TaxID=2763058 RepID=UPI003515A386